MRLTFEAGDLDIDIQPNQAYSGQQVYSVIIAQKTTKQLLAIAHVEDQYVANQLVSALRLLLLTQQPLVVDFP